MFTIFRSFDDLFCIKSLNLSSVESSDFKENWFRTFPEGVFFLSLFHINVLS